VDREPVAGLLLEGRRHAPRSSPIARVILSRVPRTARRPRRRAERRPLPEGSSRAAWRISSL
jgi:hypothetical protein